MVRLLVNSDRGLVHLAAALYKYQVLRFFIKLFLLVHVSPKLFYCLTGSDTEKVFGSSMSTNLAKRM